MTRNEKSLKKKKQLKSFEHGKIFLITSKTIWTCSKLFDHSQTFLDVAVGQGISEYFTRTFYAEDFKIQENIVR